MKMSGTRQIQAPQADVWAKLNDVDVLKRCIPGCESLEKVGDNDLKSTVAVKMGPMNVRFSGAVTLSDLDPPTSYRISGKGQGGAAGFASGGANVHLAPQDGGTLLTYDVDATVGGKIAQLGARLIDATAASLANQFFDRFAAELAPAAAAAPQHPAASATVAGTSAAAEPSRRDGTLPSGSVKSGNTWLWWAVGALAVLAAFYLLRR
jgi:uncharacterized protein